MSLRDEVENRKRIAAVKQQVDMDRQSNRAQQEAIINSRFEKMAKKNEDWLRRNLLSIVQEFNLLFLNGEGEIIIGHHYVRYTAQAFGNITLIWGKQTTGDTPGHSNISFFLESGTLSVMFGKQERPGFSIWVSHPFWKEHLEKRLADIIANPEPRRFGNYQSPSTSDY